MIVLTAGGRSASTFDNYKHLHLCLAFQLLSQSENWSTLETLGIKECCQYHCRWGLCAITSTVVCWSGAYHTKLCERCAPTWNLTGKRKGRFWLLQSRVSFYSMQTCNNNSSRKSTSCWTSVTLRKSYIQFPSTTHTCVQGPCLHKWWLTNDLDSQTITMMNLAFPRVKKKKKNHPKTAIRAFARACFSWLVKKHDSPWVTLNTHAVVDRRTQVCKVSLLTCYIINL